MMIGINGKYATEPFYLTRCLQMDGQTDGRMDRVIPVYPTYFVVGGIMTITLHIKQNKGRSIIQSYNTIYIQLSLPPPVAV